MRVRDVFITAATFAATLCWSALAVGPQPYHAAAARLKAGGGLSYDFTETFEGSEAASGDAETGYDQTGWTVNNTACTPNYNTNIAPLVGSYSYGSGALPRNLTRSITPASEVWVYLRFQENATSTNSYFLIKFLDASDNVLGAALPRANRDEIYAYHGSVKPLDNDDDWGGEASENHIWVRWVAETGAGNLDGITQIYHSTDGNIGSVKTEVTTGDADASCAKIQFSPTTDVAIDNIIIHSSAIGSNPL